jgi:hypothetical protein
MTTEGDFYVLSAVLIAVGTILFVAGVLRFLL